MKTNLKSKVEQRRPDAEMQQLCLECGLCCNGVLFADVRLQTEDDAGKLRKAGLEVSKRGTFKQPCAALAGCECTIYLDRPSYCRKFECLLFRKVRTGETPASRAFAIVKETRAAVAKVERLLIESGAEEQHVPLRKRFQTQAQRMESSVLDPGRAELFGQLTLAYHELNLLLREQFYP